MHFNNHQTIITSSVTAGAVNGHRNRVLLLSIIHPSALPLRLWPENNNNSRSRRIDKFSTSLSRPPRHRQYPEGISRKIIIINLFATPRAPYNNHPMSLPPPPPPPPHYYCNNGNVITAVTEQPSNR